MIKLSDKNKEVELELPVRVLYGDKEYWIKKSTKVNGIYMNTQSPPLDIVVKESDSVTISK